MATTSTSSVSQPRREVVGFCLGLERRRDDELRANAQCARIGQIVEGLHAVDRGAEARGDLDQGVAGGDRVVRVEYADARMDGPQRIVWSGHQWRRRAQLRARAETGRIQEVRTGGGRRLGLSEGGRCRRRFGSRQHLQQAKGEAERILQAAQGYRDQVIAESKGEADRFLKVYEQYKKAPEVTRRRMFIDTMQKVLGDTDKVIIDGKAGTGVVPYLPLSEFGKRPAPTAPEGQQ